MICWSLLITPLCEQVGVTAALAVLIFLAAKNADWLHTLYKKQRDISIKQIRGQLYQWFNDLLSNHRSLVDKDQHEDNVFFEMKRKIRFWRNRNTTEEEKV